MHQFLCIIIHTNIWKKRQKSRYQLSLKLRIFVQQVTWPLDHVTQTMVERLTTKPDFTCKNLKKWKSRSGTGLFYVGVKLLLHNNQRKNTDLSGKNPVNLYSLNNPVFKDLYYVCTFFQMITHFSTQGKGHRTRIW